MGNIIRNGVFWSDAGQDEMDTFLEKLKFDYEEEYPKKVLAAFLKKTLKNKKLKADMNEAVEDELERELTLKEFKNFAEIGLGLKGIDLF